MQPEARRRDPTPNGTLRVLLDETEWTQEAFARAIARLGGEAGVRLTYNRTSVARWLRGSRPAPRVQGFIAEALSRRLGRPVTVAELGMGDGHSGGPGPRHRGGRPEPSEWTYVTEGRPSRPADQLAALTSAVVGPPRADSPPPAPYRLTLLTAARTSGRAPAEPAPPVRGADAPHLLPGPDHGTADSMETGTAGARGDSPGIGDVASETPEPLRPRPPRAAPSARGGAPAVRGGRPARRTAPDEVASVREHVRFFAQQADRHGGGHIRTTLAASLAALVRRLRTGGEGPHHPRLLAGAARLSYLMGRVYADEQRHGLAQRAFLTASELALEGGDPEGVALARRALSTQAHQLGHRRQSLELAVAACESAPADAAPSVRAFLHAGLAVARAAAGEHRGALAALHSAEHELARSPADLTTGPESPNGEPVGAYQDAALHYQAGQVRAALGDRAGAVRELRASLHSRPEGESRSRALSEAELAETLLSLGRVEESCAAWETFLDDSALIRSGRARRARDRMPRLLHPYAQEPCVQALLTRAGMPLRRQAAE